LLIALVAAAFAAAPGSAPAAPSAAAGGACPADRGAGSRELADPWLLTNDVSRYPGIAEADGDGDGYACVFDPFLVTITTVVADDGPQVLFGGFQLLTLDDVRRLENLNLLTEAIDADRNGNGEVVVKFIEGEPDEPIILDNVYPDERHRSSPTFIGPSSWR